MNEIELFVQPQNSYAKAAYTKTKSFHDMQTIRAKFDASMSYCSDYASSLHSILSLNIPTDLSKLKNDLSSKLDDLTRMIESYREKLVKDMLDFGWQASVYCLRVVTEINKEPAISKIAHATVSCSQKIVDLLHDFEESLRGSNCFCYSQEYKNRAMHYKKDTKKSKQSENLGLVSDGILEIFRNMLTLKLVHISFT